MTTLPLLAVSSFRPNATGEVAANQIRAIRSWQKAFDFIYLFGPEEPDLAAPNVFFIKAEDFPRISLMVWLASRCADPVAILNADIVVAEHIRRIANIAWGRGAGCWTSRRAEFDQEKPDYDAAKVVDFGADIFCAYPYVWELAYRYIPTCYRLGHQRWDSWLLGFFGLMFKRRFVDMTKFQPIFHPRHGDRKMPHLVEPPEDRFITSGLGFPPYLNP